MNRKSYADSITDRVLAESYRRTWYFLFVQQSTRLIKHSQSKIKVTEIRHDVDLPCEEWEFDSGVGLAVMRTSMASSRADEVEQIIPTPLSVAEYETRKKLSRAEFSSLTYLIDICKIRVELVLPYIQSQEDKKKAWLDRTDSRICDFLRRVPRWKLDLVNQDGVADLVIHTAVNLAHV